MAASPASPSRARSAAACANLGDDLLRRDAVVGVKRHRKQREGRQYRIPSHVLHHVELPSLCGAVPAWHVAMTSG